MKFKKGCFGLKNLNRRQKNENSKKQNLTNINMGY